MFGQWAPPSRVSWIEPVVGPDPDLVRLAPFGDRKDRVVNLDAGIVLGQRPARCELLRLVVTREVGRDDRPALPLVGRLEQDLGAEIERMRIVARNHDRRRPLEAVLEVLGAQPIELRGHGVMSRVILGAIVVARQLRVIAAGVDEVRDRVGSGTI